MIRRSLQLSGHQCTTSNQTRRGSRRCNGIGRYIQYAYLAETGTDGTICLVPSDITAVLGEQNIEAPTGSLGESSKNVFQFTMKYRGRLKSVEEFQNTVIRSQSDGSVLRLKDVADVQLGTMTYSFRSEMDSKPAVLYMVFQTAGSNATAVNKEITAQMKQMEKSLPEGTEFVTMMSSNDFLFASIHNVVETLIIAIILVILVVYFFLQDLKSTLIPSISIIVSLVGTFCLPGGCGIQSEYPDTVCTGACHWYGGGRCHCGGGSGAVQI